MNLSAAQEVAIEPGIKSVVDLGSNPSARETATLIGILNAAAVQPNQLVSLVRSLVSAPITVDLTSIYKHIGVELAEAIQS